MNRVRNLRVSDGWRKAVSDERANGHVADFRLEHHWVRPAANLIGDIRVGANAMDVLVALVEAAPGVVPVTTLLDRVWARVVVGDNVVHQAISQLRRALGDDARTPRYI